MTEEKWILIDATLTTSQAIEAYGGIRFSREVLEKAAASLNAGTVPMHADHDQTKPIRARNIRAWVDDSADGFYRLKLKYEIHPDEEHYVANRQGMSAAMTAPLNGREDTGDVQAPIELSADHAWFDDPALLAAERLVLDSGVPEDAIRTERVYQFSFIPDPQIFVSVILPFAGVVATGALGSALWDAVKLLFRSRRTPPNGDVAAPTRMNLRLEDGERSLTGVLETQDETIADRAIDAFEGLAREFIAQSTSAEAVPDPTDRQLLLWDDAESAWVPHSPAQIERPRPPVDRHG